MLPLTLEGMTYQGRLVELPALSSRSAIQRTDYVLYLWRLVSAKADNIDCLAFSAHEVMRIVIVMLSLLGSDRKDKYR